MATQDKNLIVYNNGELQKVASTDKLQIYAADFDQNVAITGTLAVTDASTFTGAISGSSASLSSTLGVSGVTTLAALNANNTAITGTLSTSGKSTLDSLEVTHAAALKDTLAVTGASTFTGAISGGNASLSGTLGVSGASTLASASVTGNATVGGTLGVTGATSLSSVSTSGNASVGGTLGVTGTSTLGVLSAGASTLDSASVTGNASVGGTLGVTGKSTLGVVETGAATLASASVTGNATVGGTFGVTGATTLSDTLAVTGAATLSDALAVAKNFSVNTDKFTVAYSSGNTAVAGTLNVTGASTLASATVTNALSAGSATVTNAVSAGSATVTGALSAGSISTVGTLAAGATTLGATTATTFDASGNTTVGGTLGVTGATTLSSTLGVTGNTTVGGTFGATGNATLGGTLAVSGNTTLSGTLGAGASTLASASITGNATVGGTLGVTGATTLSDTLAVTGLVTMSGGSAVLGNMSVSGDLTVGGDLNVMGTTVNVVTKDSFIDLGNGNSAQSSKSGGFTVSMQRSAGADIATVTAFDGAAKTFTYTGGASLAAGQIVSISGAAAPVPGNNGLFVIKSVSGGVATIEDTNLGNVQFVQTAFETGSNLTGISAYQVDLAVVAVADGINYPMPGIGSTPKWQAGNLLTAYVTAATLSLFNANGAYKYAGQVGLNDAYGIQNAITLTNSRDLIVNKPSGADTAAIQYTSNKASYYRVADDTLAIGVWDTAAVNAKSKIEFLKNNVDYDISLSSASTISATALNVSQQAKGGTGSWKVTDAAGTGNKGELSIAQDGSVLLKSYVNNVSLDAGNTNVIAIASDTIFKADFAGKNFASLGYNLGVSSGVAAKKVVNATGAIASPSAPNIMGVTLAAEASGSANVCTMHGALVQILPAPAVTFNVGDVAYLAANGEISNVAPTASGSYVMRVGFVVNLPNASEPVVQFAPQFIAKVL